MRYKPNNKYELVKLIDDDIPGYLIDTRNIADMNTMFMQTPGIPEM